ncbi:PQQ-binding-like beta-propeller repeat protein [Streptomyces sp. MAR4 CNX-425]|uniref:protein kinase domain-containing protein n=1 Tax=Streptomyces sp. MAR4 CNX-425 TaxID=3406343 RepID=UPI003B5129A3
MFTALEAGDPRQVGRYRIVARLGAGGMGQVFLGRSPGGRSVAVKVVRSELAQDPGFRRRFAREVATARRVTGFFTAGVVDADPEGSPAWLATEYVPGLPLGDAVETHGPWPEHGVLALAAGLAEALEAIHAAGVVHRDLKPSNVLLAQDGPRVIDFGISVAAEASVLTQTGTVIGTPGFMSPEQLTGGRNVGPATDVFALGALLVYTATGNGPFGTGSFQALNYRIVHEQPDLSALPPVLRDVVARCIAKDPEQRPSVTSLVTELAHAPGDDNSWLPPAVATALRDPARVSPPPSDDGPATPPPAAGPGATPASPASAASAASAQGPASVEGPAPAPAQGPAPAPAEAPAPAPAPADPTMPAAPRRAPGEPPVPERQPAPAPNAPAAPLHQAATAPATPDAPAAAPHPPTAPATPPRPSRRPAPSPRPPSSRRPASSRPHVVRQPNNPLPEPAPPPKQARSRREALATLGTLGAMALGFTAWQVLGDDGDTTNDDKREDPADDAEPGTLLWDTSKPLLGPVASYVEDMIYVGGDKKMHAIDPINGKERWSVSLGERVHTRTVVDDKARTAYVADAGGTLHALDTSDGSTRWTYPLGRKVLPSDPAFGDGAVYVAGTGNLVHAVDAKSGRRRWTAEYATPGDRAPAAPVVGDGTVYVGAADGKLHAFDTGGRPRWHYVAGGSLNSAPALSDDTVYVGSTTNGVVHAVNVANGGQRWTFRARGEISGLALSGTSLYFHNYTDTLYGVYTVVGTHKSSYPLASEIRVDPVVGFATVFLGHEDGTMRAVSVSEEAWVFRTSGRFLSPPTATNKAVYFTATDGRTEKSTLYAIAD